MSCVSHMMPCTTGILMRGKGLVEQCDVVYFFIVTEMTQAKSVPIKVLKNLLYQPYYQCILKTKLTRKG